jgi:hypothetical protein
MDSAIDQLEKIEEDVSVVARPNIIDVTSSFSGAIFRKAEFENSFEKVYSRVIEKMIQFQFVEHDDRSVLEVFGIVGG